MDFPPFNVIMLSLILVYLNFDLRLSHFGPSNCHILHLISSFIVLLRTSQEIITELLLKHVYKFNTKTKKANQSMGTETLMPLAKNVLLHSKGMTFER